MAYTFIKAQGHEIGKSLLEEDKLISPKNYWRLMEIKLFYQLMQR